MIMEEWHTEEIYVPSDHWELTRWAVLNLSNIEFLLRNYFMLLHLIVSLAVKVQRGKKDRQDTAQVTVENITRKKIGRRRVVVELASRST